MAYFMCNYGYATSGAHSTVCQTSGTWDQETPICIQGNLKNKNVFKTQKNLSKFQHKRCQGNIKKQWRIQDFTERKKQSQRWRRQPIILVNYSQTRMKINEIDPTWDGG